MQSSKVQYTEMKEMHLVNRINWLRAAVLGANDGILSISSIISGMVAGGADHKNILLAGVAAIIAGATSMATGEYVSVSSQADTETADLKREKLELANYPDEELEELAQIYVSRGVEVSLARDVAKQLMKRDALAAHARDELGISEVVSVNPMQAALASAASFIAGAILPLAVTIISPQDLALFSVGISSLASLAILGALSAYAGGVAILKPMMRISLWGVFSLILAAMVGTLFR